MRKRRSPFQKAQALETGAYGTELADSAEKANKILRSGEPIILTICDLTMPGTDGRAFLAEIRSTPWLAGAAGTDLHSAGSGEVV
jgi:Response regulator receiver domain.